MRYIAVSTKSPTSEAVTVYVGGPFSHSYTRANRNSVWRCDQSGTSMGKRSVQEMRARASYDDEDRAAQFFNNLPKA
jgi:hypothetical protein